MKGILILLILFTLCSCGQKLGEFYFDFDNVEHYSIEIDENELFELEEKKYLSESEKLQIELVINDFPESISDTLFINKLEKSGFTKTLIEKSKNEDLNNLFREKSHKESLYAACIAAYRDILIFRKNGKVIGIAKICFSCSQNRIIGTDANTFEFGQSGDYGKLAKILNE